MSTSIAISAASLAIAANASVQAEQAKKTACTGYLNNYQPQKATVAEMREYARCVDLLHPEPVTDPGALLLIKIAIVVCLLGGGFGVWWGTLEGGVLDVVFGFILGILGTACGLMIAYGLFYAVRFLFT